MAVATVSDVELAIGRPISSTAEQDQVNFWLDGVELVIAARLGDVTLLDQSVLVYVETEAVAEKVRRNGRAESSVTVAVDDGSVTRRYENVSSTGDITEDWWKMLDPNLGSHVFSARPQFEPDTANTTWGSPL